MVVHATSPKPFPSPLARVVVAPLQMRNLNVKTPSSLWTFHHAVPSPSFSTWELSVTENQCQITMQGGNMGESHIAVDCPTRRAAIVADIRNGRLLDVPA